MDFLRQAPIPTTGNRLKHRLAKTLQTIRLGEHRVRPRPRSRYPLRAVKLACHRCLCWNTRQPISRLQMQPGHSRRYGSGDLMDARVCSQRAPALLSMSCGSRPNCIIRHLLLLPNICGSFQEIISKVQHAYHDKDNGLVAISRFLGRTITYAASHDLPDLSARLLRALVLDIRKQAAERTYRDVCNWQSLGGKIVLH